MHKGNGHQRRALFLVEVVKIGLVLEVVGVQFLAFQSQVGLHIIRILDDLQVIALSLELFGRDVKNLGVGRRRGPDLDDLGGHGGSGRQGQCQQCGEQCKRCFFLSVFLFQG